ncbi:MAG: ubiquitin-like domain-containing protein, partial [Nocardioides sp.]|nr:ubiquitin-like domain-containing protein [Nocardioides sp.]
MAALAVGGTTVGYASLSTTVAMSVDGETREVTTFGDTVGEVLASEGIEVGPRDVVAPGLDEAVEDGTSINVRFARPFEVTVDGQKTTHWVHATDVASALGEIGRSFRDSELSASRGLTISRGGLELEVVTPKKLTVKIGPRKPVTRTVVALTVEEALEELGVEVHQPDETKPGLAAVLQDGDKIVFTNVRIVRKSVQGEAVDFETVEREDDTMTEGDTNVVRAGREGLRNVTYRLEYRNGELVVRKVLKQKLLRKPVSEIVEVGTAPAVEAYATGNTV